MKLPAFGKSLLQARFQGGHPELIQVIYGDLWVPARDDAPLLAVKPQEFAPGIYDWRCVAGVAVEFHHRAQEPEDWARAAVGFVASELAEWSPCVELVFADGLHYDVAVLAFACRSARKWPTWWSERLEFDYGRRKEAYFTERLRRVAA
jgi:hypothetical protein